MAADLPKLIEETVFVDMEQEERYFPLLQLLKEGRIIKSGTHSPQKERMQILEAITRLRQIVCHHELFSITSTDKDMESHSIKWELLFEEVQTLILDGKKVLILSHFSAIIDLIIDRAEKEYGWRGVAYLGSTGLNITAADAVLIYDPWWNRSVEDQAIGRAHRMGRKEHVIVKRYITQQSIEGSLRTISVYTPGPGPISNTVSPFPLDFESPPLNEPSLFLKGERSFAMNQDLLCDPAPEQEVSVFRERGSDRGENQYLKAPLNPSTLIKLPLIIPTLLLSQIDTALIITGCLFFYKNLYSKCLVQIIMK
ncbi:hypothetical protein ACTFIW_008740 [Dictyostelium discoideum]